MSNFSAVLEAAIELRSLTLSKVLETKDMFLFKRTIAYIEFRVKVSDEFITVPSLIDEVEQSIKRSMTEIQAFINNNNEDFFNSSKTHILNAAKSSTGFAQVLNQTENTYLIDALKNNDEAVQRLKAQVSELQSNLLNIKTESSELISNLTNEFKKLVDGADGAPGWKQQVSNALIQLETEFHQELYGSENGKKGWVASSKAIESELTNILNEGISLGRIIGVDNLSKNERSIKELKFMEKIKQKCTELLSQMGLGASVGGYQERANSERLSGMFWTGCIVAIFLWLVFSNTDLLEYFNKHNGQETIYQYLLFRIIVSLPFIAFMFFAGFKAKSHRKMELKYRQFALELASFEPNLQGVDQDARGFAKLLFMQKTFGNIDTNEKFEKIDLDAISKNIESFKTGINSVKEIVKKTTSS